ncbi:protein of unknown function [Clostridium beijerinckii]|nr:protein of unknown function [Clostridium beijerinckii]
MSLYARSCIEWKDMKINVSVLSMTANYVAQSNQNQLIWKSMVQN